MDSIKPQQRLIAGTVFYNLIVSYLQGLSSPLYKQHLKQKLDSWIKNTENLILTKKKRGQKYEEITFVVGKILTQYNILVLVTKETTNI